MKGGIASLLSVYKKYYEPFNFISTIISNNKLYTTIFFPFKFCLIIIYIIFNKNIQIVHIHGASNGSFVRKYILFIPIKFVFNKKIIYHLHGGGFQKFFKMSPNVVQKLIIHFINNSDTIICLSREWKEFLLSNFKPKNVYIINNVIETPDSSFKNKNTSSKIVFLFLGKIEQDKGVFDLLDIISENRIYFKDKMLLQIGGNGEISKLLNYINSNQLNHLVQYIGWITNSQKNQVFQNSDVFILPSYFEVQPVSILEAMSYGLPVISTNVGGIPEIVEENTNALLSAPGDKTKLMEHMSYFLENNPSIKVFGSNSQKLVETYYPKCVFREINSVYEQLLVNNE